MAGTAEPPSQWGQWRTGISTGSRGAALPAFPSDRSLKCVEMVLYIEHHVDGQREATDLFSCHNNCFAR